MTHLADAPVPVEIAAPLPVFATVGRAYGAALDNAASLVRVAWFWCLALLAVHALSALYLPTWMTNPAEIMRLDSRSLLLVSAAGLVNGLVILPILASIAVNWHRLLLLGEKPGPGAFLRLDRLVWSYVWLAAMLVALRYVMSLPQVMISLQHGPSGAHFGPEHAVALLLSLGALVLLPRLSLALPGIAIGDERVGLARGIEASRGNTWRLFFGAVLCFVPAGLLAAFTFGVWPGYATMLGNEPLALWVRAFEAMLWPFVGIIVVGYLSHAYAHFFPDRIEDRRLAA